tara:strand:+ start:147341 stop:147712 length:372 start_codon:yes stop_codon:yes gene_type:complete
VRHPKIIRCKRVYESPARNDGYRVLVDRIWPRGIKKSDLALDEWCKELAPSAELRQWFAHDPQRWAGFYQKFHNELGEQANAIRQVMDNCGSRPLTLLYAARDTEHNNAVALKMFLDNYKQSA